MANSHQIGATAHTASAAAPFPRCIPTELFRSIGLSTQDLERVQTLIFLPRRIAKGQNLFHCGQTFREIFAVRSGSFKSGLLSRHGDMQVNAFHLPGDMLGFDGIAQQRHQCEVQALEDSEVCAMPFEHVALLSRELQPVQRLILQMMGQQIVRDSAVIVMLSLRAEERVATFLISLLERLGGRGFSASELVLPMSRQDIASFLGLKTETVSRAFATLAEAGLVHVHNRTVRVSNQVALKAMAPLAIA